MNKEGLKKNVGFHVKLAPIPCRLDEFGRTLPAIDDDWIIQNVSNDGARVSNIRTGHATVLAHDHIHHFTSNASSGGVQRGFLTLLVQIYLQGINLTMRPTLRPGEPVPPPAVEIVEKWVNMRYLPDSGLQEKLEVGGYRLYWSGPKDLAQRIELEGWEIALHRDENGRLFSFHIEDRGGNLSLIRKRG